MNRSWHVVAITVTFIFMFPLRSGGSTCDVSSTSCPLSCTCSVSDLIKVDCARNKMTDLPEVVPTCRGYKLHLIFSENDLKTIPYRSYFTEAAILDFSFNEITHLDVNVLDKKALPVVHSLFIHNNELQTLPLRAKRTFDSLQRATIYNNPWSCDCNIKWVKEWVSESHDSHTAIENVANITCGSPEQLRGLQLKEIAENKLCSKNSNSKLFLALGLTAAGVAYVSLLSAFGFCIVLRRRQKITDQHEFSNAVTAN